MYISQVFFFFFLILVNVYFAFFLQWSLPTQSLARALTVSFETVLRSIAEFSALTDFFKYLTKSINILTNTRAASFQSQILN